MNNPDPTQRMKSTLEAYEKDVIRRATGKVVGGMHLSPEQALADLVAIMEEVRLSGRDEAYIDISTKGGSGREVRVYASSRHVKTVELQTPKPSERLEL